MIKRKIEMLYRKIIPASAFVSMCITLSHALQNFSCKQESRRVSGQFVVPVLEDANNFHQWDSAWSLDGNILSCKSNSSATLLKSWLRLDSSGYDSGVWLNINGFDYCQSKDRWNEALYPNDYGGDWPFYPMYAQPWFSDQSPCEDTAFGYPPDQPRYDLLSWPRNAAPLPVRGLMVFELLAGSDTVYNYVPFQLNYWNAPIQPDEVRSRGQVSRSAPVRLGDGWLLPAEAVGPVTAWDARGHRLALRQETTAEGVRVQLPPGRGLAFLRAGTQRWSVLR